MITVLYFHSDFLFSKHFPFVRFRAEKRLKKNDSHVITHRMVINWHINRTFDLGLHQIKGFNSQIISLQKEAHRTENW